MTDFAAAADNTIQLAEARETARGLLGADFDNTMIEVGAMIMDISEKKGVSILSAGIALAKVCQQDGRAYSAIYALAATVELMSPSAPARHPESEG